MELILHSIRELIQYRQLLQVLQAGGPIGNLGIPRAARLPLTAAVYADMTRPILFLTDRADHAVRAWEELGVWLKGPRFLLAEPNPLFYERSPWSSTIRRDRLQALVSLVGDRLPASYHSLEPPVVVASVRALMTRTMPVESFLGSCHTLDAGDAVKPELARRHLAEIGYTRSNIVLEPGQFSSRGGILDLWPPAQARPLRLEFFADEIEAIRAFDPSSQRTIETLDSVLVTPASEFIVRGATSAGDSEEASTPLSEFHIPVNHPDGGSCSDYLSPIGLVFIDDVSMVESMANEIEEQAVALRHSSIDEGTLPSDFPMPYVTWSELGDQLQSRGFVELGGLSGLGVSTGTSENGFAQVFRHDERFGGHLKPFMEYLYKLQGRSEVPVVVSRQRARLEELWLETRHLEKEADLPGAASAPRFYEASLQEGFVVGHTHLITDGEIFGWEHLTPRARRSQAAESPESIYADLKLGDLVVHIDHGVGRYLGLAQRRLDGHEREYLAVEYGGGGQLFVPVYQADRLTRFVGAEGIEPALDRLGGHEWHVKKARVKGAVIQVAQEMLDLHAQREVVRGHAFKPDTPWQSELEDSFPYVETEDQKRTMVEIKRDMEAARPMDRLLCGDVGYGKTELALRAAFKAVLDGKQVAMLVPTTVLAQQHFETFQQRLAAFPVNIEMLSRFRSPREQGAILVGLGLADIDILIGTHRMLSGDVQFKELGLVIIDEEQRFGVSHKEHLKKLRTEVDVLTLTATPIPRTLYMALAGVRDISNLDTPPEERVPIVTHVGPYSPQLARQAIIRELERGGQTFFVHNRVNTIAAMRVHLAKLVPEARLDVGHGQMPEHELEEVMHRFNHGQTDVLLSTTIIESGLDIPNANTLIVDRADTFGLAQLYQLRGRVGRGASRGYAYFFRHRRLTSTLEAQQRLEVIAENTELGSGYSIAMRDLEIRGAGELLGTQQHGHIQAVGFHLYTRLLADSVRQIRRGQALARAEGPPELTLRESAAWKSLSAPISMPVTVDLPVAVGIPTGYVADSDLRLRLYRRIADVRDETEVDALVNEFKDRFGPLPKMVSNLFYQVRVKLRAEQAGLNSVAWESGQIVLRYTKAAKGRGGSRLADLAPGIRGGKSAYWCSFGNDPDWMQRLLNVLRELRPQ